MLVAAMRTLALLLALSLAAAAPRALPPGGGCPSPSRGPDLVLADLSGMHYWGTVGGLSAYSQGTLTCNVGDAVVPWDGSTPAHPLLGQNLYRLEHGRFEQLGLGWMKHVVAALAGSSCCPCQDPGDFRLLGVGCSDPYTAITNGDQDGLSGGAVGGLGPRSEVDPVSGRFRWPYTTQGLAGDAIYKRLRARVADIDPALHASALFFTESFLLSTAEAAAGNARDNLSWRPVIVGPQASDGGFHLLATSFTRARQPALMAWKEADPNVQVSTVDVPGDGRFVLASNAVLREDGKWRYEYALHNQSSARAARAFVVPLPGGLVPTGAGFHDVEHHSGEPYDGTDWSLGVADGRIAWSTATHALDPHANALRFGTLYNFRFEADAAPQLGAVYARLFVPGSPERVGFEAWVPAGSALLADDGDEEASARGPR